jgi:hypothetical protein
MSFSRVLGLTLVALLSSVAIAADHPTHHENKKDPAFVRGYDDGYRIGARDSEALSNAYRDQGGPVYEQATDGYTPKYGSEETYQRRFRRGYIEGYKRGWDFNAGQYSPLGTGGGPH